MEAIITSLNGHLEAALKDLKRDEIHKEIQDSLHNHDEGVLPSATMSNLASKTIDLLHEIEQMIEPGQLVLADHFLGYVHAKCLCSAVDFKIPDLLRDNGPMALPDLAIASQTRPDRLQQVLRVLCSNGIFVYDAPTNTYSNNHTSTLILSDHWTQWHNWVDLYGNQFYDMARGIPESLKKDAIRWSAQINFDTDDNMFSYFQKQGWVPQLHRTLGSGATAQAPGIVADYPWSEVANETFIDIGGGGGALVALLLRAHPQMKGGVFDLQSVIDHIIPFFHAPDGQYADISDRVPQENLIGGNFMTEIPAFKVYTMKWCLHDWRDDDALKILRNIRKSIILGTTSRLVVLESILGFSRSSRLSRYSDMNMMVTANGLERTMAEWESLADRSGWEISKVYPLRNAWPCAIDMRPKMD